MKITNEGRAQAVRYLTDTGGNPVFPNPDAPAPDDPVDVALGAFAYVPISPPGTTTFVQSVSTSTGETELSTTFSLPDPVTPGNTLIIGYTERSWSGAVTGPGGITVPDGFTHIASGVCGPSNGGATALFYRVIQSGDTGNVTFVKPFSHSAGGWMAEVACGALLSYSTDGPSAGSTTHTTPSLTATGATQFLVAALAQSTNSLTLTKDASATLIATGPTAGGSVGPAYIGQYEIVGAGSHNFDASNGADAQSWGGVIALFAQVGTGLIWVDAPLAVDADDATYESSAEIQAVRLDLGSAHVLTSARLLIGIETSGTRTYELWAGNDSDLSDAVLVATDTTVITATPGGGTTGTLVPATAGALATAVAAASPGDTLRLRGGDHLVDDIIYIDKSLTLTNYTGEVPNITHPTARPEFLFFTGGPILLDGIKFTGVGGYGDVHGSALVSMQDGSHDVTIQNCEFHGASNYGATQQLIYHHNTSGSGASILNCLIDGHGSGGFGVHLYPGPGPNDVLVQYNTIRNFPSKSGVVVWTSSSGIEILNNAFSHCGSAVRHHNSLGTTVDGNAGTDVGSGLEVDDATNLTVGTNDWASSETFAASGTYGPDELDYDITSTTAYRWWEFRGPGENTRTFTVELFAHETPTAPTAYQPIDTKGFPNGYAGLDSTSKVPTGQLPDVEDQKTMELDTNLVLTPDGSGGLVFRAAPGGEILISDSPSTPLIFGDLIQNEAQDDLVYSDS